MIEDKVNANGAKPQVPIKPAGITGGLKKPTKTWKAKTLTTVVPVKPGVGIEKIIYMDATKFKKIAQTIATKNYRSKGKIGELSVYEHRRYVGLKVYIDVTNKIIKAEANGESALNIVADEFNLPRY